MKNAMVLLVPLAVFALVPRTAEARIPRNGPVSTSFGTFNPSEMSAAGGNPFVAEQIREQRMMMQVQQQMVKQEKADQKYMEQMIKQQKANPSAFKPTTTVPRVAHKKKKRRTYVPQGTTATTTIKSDTTAKKAATATPAADPKASTETTPTKPSGSK